MQHMDGEMCSLACAGQVHGLQCASGFIDGPRLRACAVCSTWMGKCTAAAPATAFPACSMRQSLQAVLMHDRSETGADRCGQSWACLWSLPPGAWPAACVRLRGWSDAQRLVAVQERLHSLEPKGMAGRTAAPASALSLPAEDMDSQGLGGGSCLGDNSRPEALTKMPK